MKPLLLSIDTATEHASVCLTQGDELVVIKSNEDQKSHASFLQPAIKAICDEAGVQLSAIDAVAVTIGPGSYTGLRVGLASSKGICYALNKPIITLNTLQVMAYAAIKAYGQTVDNTMLYCPMIDARRKEVFTAVYDHTLKEVEKPAAKVLDADSFKALLTTHKILVSGSGNIKAKEILSSNSHLLFTDVKHSSLQLADLAYNDFRNGKFNSLAYCEPLYLKEFYSTLQP
jgi:tRNA threonylcarbamoyladenosine biosynthesis protein TsaB